MLCTLFLAVLPQGAVIPAQPALVEVKQGRARVVREGETLQLSSLDPATVARGPAHLEVTAGSVVFVTWRGLATLRFEGPAAFQWAAETAGGELDWRAVDVAALDAEVRRGTARLELPMGWQADFRAGAYHVSSLADGGTRVVHSAGEDLRIRWIGEHGPARPPAFLRAGQSVRLATPPKLASPPDFTSTAPAWGRYDWPWGAHGVPGRPDLGSGPAWSEAEWPFGPSTDEPGEAWNQVTWPWTETPRKAPVDPDFESRGRTQKTDPRPAARIDARALPAEAAPGLEDGEPVDRPDQRTAEATEFAVPQAPASAHASPTEQTPADSETAIEADPVTAQEESGSDAARALAEPQSTATDVAVPQVVEEEQGTRASDEPFVKSGVATSGLPKTDSAPPTPSSKGPQVEQRGPLKFRPNAELVFEALPEGRWNVSLPAGAQAPAQILGQRFDTWIQAGGSIHVDASGRLLNHSGPVELRPSDR